jgi:hypothetical protein
VHGTIHRISHLNKFAEEPVNKLLDAIIKAAEFFVRCAEAYR